MERTLMKIAYIVPYVPNLIRTRPYNLIRHLAALGHEVTVYTLGADERDVQDAQALRTEVAEVVYRRHPVWRSLLNCWIALPTKQPLQSVYSWNRGLADQVVERLNGSKAYSGFDVVHVEHLRGSRYGRYVKTRIPQVPVVWDSVDCISYLFEQATRRSSSLFGKFVTRFELPRTRRAEAELVRFFDHVLITSETDKEALRALIPKDSSPSPLTVLPNGVDLKFFHPNPAVERDVETLVFSGKMSYHANISMVKHLVFEIMPRIWQKRPNVRLIVVGKDPSAEIRALTGDARITVTGTVDDIRPYLWKATVSVVPLIYGAGIQNKILEAMACGVPVVATSRTLSALQAQAGKEILVADDAEEFASLVLRLIEDRPLQSKLGSAGAAYVRKYHAWEAIASQLVEVYRTAIGRVKGKTV